MPFTYDNLGRLVGVADATSAAAADYDYTYDALGRVTQITHDLDGMTPNVVVDQAYDASSNRTQLKAQVGATNDFLSNYTYDSLNRVNQITQRSQTGGNAVADKYIRDEERGRVSLFIGTRLSTWPSTISATSPP